MNSCLVQVSQHSKCGCSAVCVCVCVCKYVRAHKETSSCPKSSSRPDGGDSTKYNLHFAAKKTPHKHTYTHTQLTYTHIHADDVDDYYDDD